MRIRSTVARALWILAGLCGCFSLALHSVALAQSPISAEEKPVIQNIDPPDWWADFPAPMLLVHGSGLQAAHFHLEAEGVRIKGVTPSENGHWAFVWLETQGASAQTLTLVASTQAGEARVRYRLAARTHIAGEHAGFSPADVMYLIMPDRFADAAPNPSGDDRALIRGWHGGDLAGITAHLDYLQSLGVTTVWTTPVLSNADMNESYHGYAATNLYAIDPHFGSLADYLALADALHARGMKLVIDLVPNHVGVAHPWMNDPPAPDWFHGTRTAHLGVEHEFPKLVDPHAAPVASAHITRGWFTDEMPDLNQSNPLVAEYFIQNALWWVETAHLDGIRLDTLPYVDRRYWQQFHATLHHVYPQLTTVGEIFHRDPEVTSYFAGGREHAGIDTGLDTPFDFPLYFALRDTLAANKPMTEVAQVMAQDALYPHPERLVTFIGNHDTTRFLTDAGGSVPRVKLALGLLATLRGMPQMYAGDEIAMSGGADPDNRRDFPGGFAGDPQSAFLASGRKPVEQDLFTWTQALLAVRKAHPVLATGMQQNLLVDDDAMVFMRSATAAGCGAGNSAEHVLVAVNKAKVARTLKLPGMGTALEGCTQATSLLPGTLLPVWQAETLQLEIPAESLLVFVVH